MKRQRRPGEVVNTEVVRCWLCGDERLPGTAHLQKLATGRQEWRCDDILDCCRREREGAEELHHVVAPAVAPEVSL